MSNADLIALQESRNEASAKDLTDMLNGLMYEIYILQYLSLYPSPFIYTYIYIVNVLMSFVV